ncbi:MAG TPA: ATP-binding protein [Alphaproteobacteria bacterium]
MRVDLRGWARRAALAVGLTPFAPAMVPHVSVAQRAPEPAPRGARRGTDASTAPAAPNIRRPNEFPTPAELAELLDRLPLAVWRRAHDLTLEYANRAYRDAAIGNGADGALPELFAGAFGRGGRALAARALEKNAAMRETRHVVIDGRRRLIEVHEAPAVKGGVAGFAVDRTETETLQAELARHVAGHEDVLHALDTAIAIYGSDQRLQFFNTAFARLWQLEDKFLRTGPALGEVLEAMREQRLLPEMIDFPAFKREQTTLFTSVLEPRVDLLHLPQGSTLKATVAPHPFGGLLMTWEDVTDALVLERSYTTLAAVQRATIDNLHEGVAVIGDNGRLQLSNPEFGRLWNLSDAERAAEPHVSHIVERMRPFLDVNGDWDKRKEEIIAELTDREPQHGRTDRADGSVLKYATMPLPDGAVLLSYLDITDSIRAERALMERNAALEAADRLKSEFIANVSYELRTPLNTIIGFAEILKGLYFGSLNDRQVEYADGILESGHTLLGLINNILDLATIEAGYMTLELEPVDLHEMTAAVLLLIRERARNKKIAVEFDCPRDIGAIVLDERRLKQALFNVLSNAVKFTGSGGAITVSVRRKDDHIIITVTDTGIGISDEDRERIFRRFERGSSPQSRRSGVGLGLSLVKSFVELHGGTVELDSEPGIGTKVTLTLPARRAP